MLDAENLFKVTTSLSKVVNDHLLALTKEGTCNPLQAEYVYNEVIKAIIESAHDAQNIDDCTEPCFGDVPCQFKPNCTMGF